MYGSVQKCMKVYRSVLMFTNEFDKCMKCTKILKLLKLYQHIVIIEDERLDIEYHFLSS